MLWTILVALHTLLSHAFAVIF